MVGEQRTPAWQLCRQRPHHGDAKAPHSLARTAGLGENKDKDATKEWKKNASLCVGAPCQVL